MNRRLFAVGAVIGLLAISLGPLVGGGSSSADTALPIVAINHTTNLTDGQTLTINVKNGTQDMVASVAQVQLCRTGVAYKESTATTPAPDVVANGPNCPQSPISSSSDSVVVDQNLSPAAGTPEGETFTYRIGSSVIDWKEVDGTPQSLTCDETHTCDLVVEVRFSPGKDASGHFLPAIWHPFVYEVTYASSNPLAACGAPLADPVASGGSDFMQEAWIAWSLGACRRPGSKGALSRASFVGEGTAVTQFANGALDLAYTAGGFDKDMATGSKPGSGLTDPSLPRRPAVAVPVGLGAAVLGVGGGQTIGSHKIPYREIDMTAGEMAKMIGLGGLTQDEFNTLTSRSAPGNQQLGATGEFDLSQTTTLAAYADAEAFNWYATRYFKLFAPTAWTLPNNPAFGQNAGRARGVDADFAQADPPFTITLMSGRPAIVKALQTLTPNTQGGLWFLTDLQTANVLSFTPVSAQDSAGNFVTPTASTMAAAVPSMKADDQGILIADPTKTPAGAYPLTFVEYALVPTKPLLNDDCTKRLDAQHELTDWLTYATGPEGEQLLPAGMAPLPDSLKAQAAAAIKQVGASPVTGKCANAVQPPSIAPDAVGAPAASADGGLPTASGSSVGAPFGAGDLAQPPTLAGGPLADASSSGDATAAGDSATRNLTAIPAFAGSNSPGWSPTVLGLLGIITLTTLALAATAKSKKPT